MVFFLLSFLVLLGFWRLPPLNLGGGVQCFHRGVERKVGFYHSPGAEKLEVDTASMVYKGEKDAFVGSEESRGGSS